MLMDTITLKIAWQCLMILIIYIFYNLANSLSDIYPQTYACMMHLDKCTRMYIAALSLKISQLEIIQIIINSSIGEYAFGILN